MSISSRRSVPQIDGYVLAGGQSSRFGADKALIDIDGVPLVRKLRDLVTGFCGNCTVVASTGGRYADLGLMTIPDRVAGRGPMSGLHTALHHAHADFVLLVSCDLVGLRAEWLITLRDAIRTGDRAVAFRHEYWEPMPAVYHASIRDEVDRRLVAGPLSMQRLLDDLSARAVSRPSDWHDAVQVNTPDDLRRYLASRPEGERK